MRVLKKHRKTQVHVLSCALAFFAFSFCQATEGNAVLGAEATNVLSVLSAQYAAITNASCTVRREVSIDGRPATAISKVSWARGNRLSVQTISPEKLFTVIDGRKIWQRYGKDKTWTEKDLSSQMPSQAANMRSVPASPEEILAPLDPLSAKDIAKESENVARTLRFDFAGATNDSRHASISLLPDGRIKSMNVFRSGTPDVLLSSTEFKGEIEVLPGVWLYKRMETLVYDPNGTIKMKSRFDDIKVNFELDDKVFDKATYGAISSGNKARDWDMAPQHQASFSIARPVVWFYRKFVGPAIGSRCALEPSCSRYFLAASEKHGILGIPMIADRFVREPVESASSEWVVDSNGNPRHPDPVSNHDFWMK